MVEHIVSAYMFSTGKSFMPIYQPQTVAAITFHVVNEYYRSNKNAAFFEGSIEWTLHLATAKSS